MKKLNLTNNQAADIYATIVEKLGEKRLAVQREYAANIILNYEGSIAANYNSEERKAAANLAFLRAYMPETEEYLRHGYDEIHNIIKNKLDDFNLLPHAISDSLFDMDKLNDNEDAIYDVEKAFADGRLAKI